MSLRLSIASVLLALLTGCVSVGGTDVLFTPIGVLALHSFKPPEPPRDTVAAAASPSAAEPTADTDRLLVASSPDCTNPAPTTSDPCSSRK
jgi:hypothetical protein